jgi:uncharacterized protein
MITRKHFRMPAATLVCILVMFAAGRAAVAQTVAPNHHFINILTSGTGGVFYPVGGALSNIFAAKIPGTRPSVQSTKGSVENLNMLQQGRGEVALTIGNTLVLAWAGDADTGFKGKVDKVRGMAALYPAYIQIVATRESGIRTIADLKGKRLAVGPKGGGNEINSRQLLRAAGISYEDLGKIVFLPYVEGVDLMRNRQLDAAFTSTGLGTPAVREFANSFPVTVAEIPTAVVDKAGLPFVKGVIPKGTYKSQDTDVQTATVLNYLVTRADMPADLVYSMTKAVFDSTAELSTVHPAVAAITLERALDGMPIPLHPGAAKFFREKGVLK